MSDRGFGTMIGAMILVVLLVWSASSDGCGANPEVVRRALEAAGYRDASLGGPDKLACGRGDLWSARFTARAAAGAEVRGVVCCNLNDRCAIRF